MPLLRAAANSPNILGQWERSIDGVTFVNQALAGLSHVWLSERNGLTVLALTAALTIQRSIDGGDVWAVLAALPAAGHNNSCFEHSLGAILVGQPANAPGEIRVFRSVDVGVSWSDVLVATRIAANSRVYPGTFQECDDGSILMHDDPNAGLGDLSRVYRSVDQGATWAVSLSPAAGFGATLGNLGYLPGRQVAYFLTDDGIASLKLYRSTDEGLTWTDQAPAGLAAQNLLQAGFKTRNAVAFLRSTGEHLVTTAASFWRSSNLGITWTEDAPSSPGPSTRGGLIATQESSILVARDIAGMTMRRSIDNGVSWVTLSTLQGSATAAASIYATAALGASRRHLPLLGVR